jgi:hypothetical protein
LTRAVFALRSPDGQNLRANVGFGAETESAFRQFEIDLRQPHLFMHLLKKPQSVWFNSQNSTSLQTVITPELIRLIGKGGFFASSVFLNAAPLGLLYGDRCTQSLDETSYQAFKNIGAKVTQALLTLRNK